MTPKVISEAAKILCNTTVFVDMVSQQPWLQSKYFRIRYEDVSLKTIWVISSNFLQYSNFAYSAKSAMKQVKVLCHLSGCR